MMEIGRYYSYFQLIDVKVEGFIQGEKESREYIRESINRRQSCALMIEKVSLSSH